MVNAVEEMQGVMVEDVQADGGSTSSSTAESIEGLELGSLKVNGAHDNGIGFSKEEYEVYQLSTVGAEKKDQTVETATTYEVDSRPFKKAKCSESTFLGDPLPSPFVSTSPPISACSETIDSGTNESTILGDPTLVSTCSESPSPTMLTLSPVTDLIHEEKISADNDQQKVSPDDEKLTNEPKPITNNLTYDYLPQGIS